MNIKELEQICEKATPGPWLKGDFAGYVRSSDDSFQIAKRMANTDAQFIIAARTWMPKLLAAVKEIDVVECIEWDCYCNLCDGHWEKRKSAEHKPGCIAIELGLTE